MRNAALKHLLVASIVVSAAAAIVPNDASAQGTFYFCQFRQGLPGSPRSVVYSTPTHPLAASEADVRAAWTEYVKTHIDAERASLAVCFTGTEAVLEQNRKATAQTWRNGKFTETAWAYSSTMTALPSKPNAIYAFCMSGTLAGDKTVYATGTFEIPAEDARSTSSPVEVTYTAYLIKRYGLNTRIIDWTTSSVGCPHSFETRAAAEQHRLQAEADFRKAGRSVVETGWVYARNADTPAANPRPTNVH